jgi:hypothetical protein
LTAARLGPSAAGAIQTATNKHSFFSQQMFTGACYVLSAIVTLYLKYQVNPKLSARV